MARKLLLLFATLILVLMINFSTSKGEEFNIEWDDIVITNWDLWSAERNFHVGDTLVFAYAAGWEEVYQVTRENYEICNYEKPLITLSDSSLVGEQITRFDIKKHGHFYFLRWTYERFPCEDKHKLHIYVPESPSTNAPAPTPTSNGSNASAPSPSSNNQNTSNTPTPNPSFNGLNTPSACAPTPSSSPKSIPSSCFLLGLVLAIILF